LTCELESSYEATECGDALRGIGAKIGIRVGLQVAWKIEGKMEVVVTLIVVDKIKPK
jgi:hypothetical protein